MRRTPYLIRWRLGMYLFYKLYVGLHYVRLCDLPCLRDLDGDEYFVTWDPALIPDQMPNPQQRQSPQTQRRHSVRFASDMSRAAVDTFVQHRHNHLLGTMVNAWGEAVELTPQLANASFAKSLVPLIESAHVSCDLYDVGHMLMQLALKDMLKTGDDPEELKRQFNRLWKRPSNGLASYRSPLQDLRDLIPHEDLSKIDKFECDPTLIIREEDHEGWQFYLSEASRVCVEYNRDLADAIRDDEDAGKCLNEYLGHSLLRLHSREL